MSVEVTEQSWFSRIGGAIKGILIGLILIVISVPVLFWNEGRAVRTHQGLQEGAGAVVQVDVDQSLPENDGKFVYTSGPVTTDDVLRDQQFGVEFNGIRLERHAEMYQWVEKKKSKTKKKLGGGTRTETTYSYDKEWVSSHVDSASFHDEKGHENPDRMMFGATSQQADNVRLGGFRLNASLISQIRKPEPVAITQESIAAEIAESVTLRSEGGKTMAYWRPSSNAAASLENSENTESFEIATGPESAASPETTANLESPEATASTEASASTVPQIGDVRVWFTATPMTDVSVMSQQNSDTFEPYRTKAGTELNMLSVGKVSPETMIAAAEAANAQFTWILRGVGSFVMFLGFMLFMRPLSVLADVIPPIGTVVGMGSGLVAFVLAAIGSLVTISIAWIFYRPMLAAVLIAVAVGLLFLLFAKAKSSKQKALDSAEMMNNPNAF